MAQQQSVKHSVTYYYENGWVSLELRSYDKKNWVWDLMGEHRKRYGGTKITFKDGEHIIDYKSKKKAFEEGNECAMQNGFLPVMYDPDKH